MHRVDTATSVPALPAQDAAVVAGYFTKGNPATGVPATVPGADWFNAVQEELVSIIAAAGVALDRTAHNQVLTAINTIITAALTAQWSTLGASHTANGVQPLPGGLILQWGSMTASASNQSAHTFTYPTTFPTAVLNAFMSSTSGFTTTSGEDGTHITSISVGSLAWTHSWNSEVTPQVFRFFIIGK